LVEFDQDAADDNIVPDESEESDAEMAESEDEDEDEDEELFQEVYDEATGKWIKIKVDVDESGKPFSEKEQKELDANRQRYTDKHRRTTKRLYADSKHLKGLTDEELADGLIEEETGGRYAIVPDAEQGDLQYDRRCDAWLDKDKHYYKFSETKANGERIVRGLGAAAVKSRKKAAGIADEDDEGEDDE